MDHRYDREENGLDRVDGQPTLGGILVPIHVITGFVEDAANGTP